MALPVVRLHVARVCVPPKPLLSSLSVTPTYRSIHSKAVHSIPNPTSLLFSRISRQTHLNGCITRRAASTAASPAASSTATTLTWNNFLQLRKTRRRFNLGCSIVLSIASVGVGAGLLQDQNLEELGRMAFGLDPMFVMALWTVTFLGAGWIMGPTLGGAIFRIANSSKLGAMQIKERNFLERIRKYRADPTSSSMQNPVPDYYGEKIASVSGYRQWLKDQRAFNKKRQNFL